MVAPVQYKSSILLPVHPRRFFFHDGRGQLGAVELGFEADVTGGVGFVDDMVDD